MRDDMAVLFISFYASLQNFPNLQIIQVEIILKQQPPKESVLPLFIDYE